MDDALNSKMKTAWSCTVKFVFQIQSTLLKSSQSKHEISFTEKVFFIYFFTFLTVKKKKKKKKTKHNHTSHNPSFWHENAQMDVWSNSTRDAVASECLQRAAPWTKPPIQHKLSTKKLLVQLWNTSCHVSSVCLCVCNYKGHAVYANIESEQKTKNKKKKCNQTRKENPDCDQYFWFSSFVLQSIT